LRVTHRNFCIKIISEAQLEKHCQILAAMTAVLIMLARDLASMMISCRKRIENLLNGAKFRNTLNTLLKRKLSLLSTLQPSPLYHPLLIVFFKCNNI
jgi:hypothetical protein